MDGQRTDDDKGTDDGTDGQTENDDGTDMTGRIDDIYTYIYILFRSFKYDIGDNLKWQAKSRTGGRSWTFLDTHN